MQTPCPIFLINLAGSTARLEAAARQFAQAGVSFERIDAVDGRKMSEAEFALATPPNRGAFYSPLTRGEVGCYLSHVRVLRTIVERELPAAAIFEDDFLLKPGFTGCLAEILALGDRLPDMVKLYGQRRRGQLVHTLPGGTRLLRSTSPPICCTSTLWTLRGARKFLAGGDRMLRPIDVQFKHWWEQDLDILWASPPMVRESPEHTPVSTIGDRRVFGLRAHLKQWSYRWSYAIERECRYVGRHGPGAWLRSMGAPARA